MHGEPPDPSGWARVIARLGVLGTVVYAVAGLALLIPLVVFDLGLAFGIVYLVVAFIAWALAGRALAAAASRRSAERPEAPRRPMP